MSASRRRHKGGHHEEEHENEERWLVSFADMMTLLMCLFMVLFSISSVNVSKLQVLQKALQDAFSGKVLSGGKAIMESGQEAESQQASPEPPLPAVQPLAALNQDESPRTSNEAAAAAQGEQQDFMRLKRRIDELVKRNGLQGRVATEIRRQGLVVQLLTDKVFFDSGQAVLKPHALALLDPVAKVIGGERRHPVVVEGHTDSQPVSGGAYPSNWELSGARAGAVVRLLAGDGVLPRRLSLTGYADEDPVATNTTEAGRARNRRVEIVLTRLHTEPTTP